jgi:hypothetical protein
MASTRFGPGDEKKPEQPDIKAVTISTNASDERRIVSTIPLMVRSVSPLPMIGETSVRMLDVYKRAHPHAEGRA